MKLKTILLSSFTLAFFSCNAAERQITMPNAQDMNELLTSIRINQPNDQAPFLTLSDKTFSALEIATQLETLLTEYSRTIFGAHIQMIQRASIRIRKAQLLGELLKNAPEALQELEDQGLYDPTIISFNCNIL